MSFVGITFISLGVVLGLLNWVLFIRREINKGGASVVPVVAVVFVVLGSIFTDSQIVRSYLWLILFIDFAAIPMVAYIGFKAFLNRLFPSR